MIMKKTYQSPIMNIVRIASCQHLLDASQSGGVATGGTPGDEYNVDDVSYGRRGSGFWGDED